MLENLCRHAHVFPFPDPTSDWFGDFWLGILLARPEMMPGYARVAWLESLDGEKYLPSGHVDIIHTDAVLCLVRNFTFVKSPTD